MWTLDALAEQVGLVLTQDQVDQHSQRVTDLPTGRIIRYYTTHGLVDRPSAYQGRTALYGWRHLLQIVAIKRLQAAGLSLTAIQERLLGLSDEQLAAIAQLPAQAEALPPSSPGATPARRRQAFWAQAAEPIAAASVASSMPTPPPVGPLVQQWQSLPLTEGAWLVLAEQAAWTADDLAAVKVAAAPLLEVLYRRGLLGQQAEGRTS
jgi:DNA-binding transcriptional MerR regulator